MGSRNNNGNGSVFQRADGRWVAAIQVGVKANGSADIRTKYEPQQTEPEEAGLENMLDSLGAFG